MKRIALVSIILCAPFIIAATPRKSNRPVLDRTYPGSIQTGTEVEIVASDTSMAPASSPAWELVTRTAFTIMPRADTLRIISTNVKDSSYVTIYGVKNTDLSNAYEILRVSGTDSVWGTTKWKWFEAAILDSLCTGTVSIVGKTSGVLSTVLGGQKGTQAALHYTGLFGSGVKHMSVEVDSVNTVQVQLRFYPYQPDLLNIPDQAAYQILDQSIIRGGAVTLSPERRYEFNPLRDQGAPIQLERTGVLALFAKGTTTTKVYNARLGVYDRTR